MQIDYITVAQQLEAVTLIILDISGGDCAPV